MKSPIIPKDNQFSSAKEMLDAMIASMQFWIGEDEDTKLIFTAMRELSRLLTTKMVNPKRKFKNVLLIINLQDGRKKEFTETNLCWLPRTKDPRKYRITTKQRIIDAVRRRMAIDEVQAK